MHQKQYLIVKIVYFSNLNTMQKLFKISILVALVTMLGLAACTSSKKGQCGCPAKNGMVGY
jgi:hypothetical protein